MIAAIPTSLPILVAEVPSETGIFAYVVAALICAVAALSALSRKAEGKGFWTTMAVVDVLLAIEVPFGFRSVVAGWFERLFLRFPGGATKSIIQLVGLTVIGIAFIVALLAVVLREETPRSRRTALFGLVLALLAWSLEAVASQTLAPLLYERLGPLVLVAWIWVVSAFLVCVGALRALSGQP